MESSSIIRYCIYILIIGNLVTAFVPAHLKNAHTKIQSDLCAAKKDEGGKKKGYQFGDITKNLLSKVTNKQDYEFGDVSRALDKTVKEKVATMSGKDKDSYEFGDLTKLLDSKMKEQANEFTNKESYKFGDISKEVLSRIKTRDYTMDDMFLLLKILLAFGSGLSPIAKFLPAKFLIEMLDYSIVGDVSQKVAGAVSTELDKRMKKAFTGDEEYKLGDASKKAVLNYIGKDEYKFGDITNFVVDAVGEKKQNEKNSEGSVTSPEIIASNLGKGKASILGGENSALIAKELDEWDKKFIVDVEFEDISSNSTSPIK